MPSSLVSEDLKNTKTEKLLYAAMFSLLRAISFRKITIKGICEEASISRATFYAHFLDKYDLLKHWMPELWPKPLNENDAYEQIERAINCHILENTTVLKNLIDDADDETIHILYDSILSTINLSTEKSSGDEPYAKTIVLANFYAGGMISYLLWQIKHKFPPDLPPMNRYLYELIQVLQDW